MCFIKPTHTIEVTAHYIVLYRVTVIQGYAPMCPMWLHGHYGFLSGLMHIQAADPCL